MKTLLSLCALAAGLSLAQAQNYVATLTPADDGGGLRTGSGSVFLTLSGTALSLNGSFTGLSTNWNNDHIHGPALSPPPASAGVLYGIQSITTPALGTSTFGTINGNVTLVDGTGGFTLAQQLNQLNSGQWYVNVHSTAFPGGEIRGTITAVPEPSTLALVVLGAATRLWYIRRRKN